MVTEQKATLEQVLGNGQVSEEAVPEEKEDEVVEEEAKGENEGDAKVETTAETEARVEAQIRAETDKSLNTYRETRETDAAFIRGLKEQLRELRAERYTKRGSSRIEAILSGDEDAGFSPEDTKSREQALKEFNELYKDYKEKSADVEEAAEVISKMADTIAPNIVKEFGLNDANPSLRAQNGAKFLEETVAVYKHNQDFLMAIETFLPKGDEVRKQLEDIAGGLADFTDDKSKKLYLKDRLQGVKVVRKKPPAPSGSSGGQGWRGLDPDGKVKYALEHLK